MTDIHDAPLIGSMVQYIEDNSLMALPVFLFRVGRDLVLPVLIALCAFGGTATVLHQLWRIVNPASSKDRYRQAKNLYRHGRMEEALDEWSALKTFGPAYLSRATHALYVALDPQQTLTILRLAKEQQVLIQTKQVEMIRLDAQALQSGGNVAMLDMNARLAKQDHLGVTTL